VKPSMLHANGNPLKIRINGYDREDLYELSRDGKWLARRVELPHWLSDKTRELRNSRQYLLETLSVAPMEHPKEEQGESHGHILIEAHRYTNQILACVGVDTPIVEMLSKKPPERIQFFVYFTDYVPCERWSISWRDFLTHGIKVEAEPPFMPQIMIPVSKLIRVG
jgi:hypothetical protein